MEEILTFEDVFDTQVPLLTVKRRPRTFPQMDDSSCGVGTILSVLDAYGVSSRPGMLRDKLPKSPLGVSAYNLMDCLNSFGFKVEAIEYGEQTAIEGHLFPFVLLSKNHFSVAIEQLEPGKISTVDTETGSSKNKPVDLKTGDVLIFLNPENLKHQPLPKSNLVAKMIALVRERQLTYITLVLLSLTLPILQVMLAKGTNNFIDLGVQGQSSTEFQRLLLHIAGIISMIIGVGFIRDRITFKLSYDMESSLHIELLNRLCKIRYMSFTNFSRGEILQRFGDISKVEHLLYLLLIQFPIDAFSFFYFGSYLFGLDKMLGLMCVSAAFAIVAASYIFISRTKPLLNKTWEANAAISTLREAFLSSWRSIKANEKFGEVSNEYINRYISLVFTQRQVAKNGVLLRSSLFSVNKFLYVVVLGILGWRAFSGELSIGKIVGSLAVVMSLLDPIQNVVRLWENVSTSKISFLRVEELFDVVDSAHDIKANVSDQINSVSIQGGYVKYPQSSTPVLQEVSLTLEKGITYALVGENGTGKSSLLLSFLGLLQLQKGKMQINGKDADEAHLKGMRLRSCYLSDSDVVFKEDHPIMSREEVSLVLKEAGFGDLLELLESRSSSRILDLFSLRINEFVRESTRYSVGQLQLYRIIAAIIHKKEFLVLDEMMSSLDSVIQGILAPKLLSYYGDKIVLMASHEWGVSKKADRILWISQHKVHGPYSPEEFAALDEPFVNSYTHRS